MGDNPSRSMSPSSMARLAARFRCAPDARRPGEGTTKSPPEVFGGSEGRGRAQLRRGPSPSSSQKQDAKPRAPESPTWPPSRTAAAPLLPLGFLGWGSRPASPPPGLPADTALAPPRAQRDAPAATRTPRARARGAGEEQQRSVRGPGPPPAACSTGRVSTRPGQSYQSGRPVGPRGGRARRPQRGPQGRGAGGGRGERKRALHGQIAWVARVQSQWRVLGSLPRAAEP